MTPAERAVLDAALKLTDPDRRLAALARLIHLAHQPWTTLGAWRAFYDAFYAERKKPAPVRELVSETVRWRVEGVCTNGAFVPRISREVALLRDAREDKRYLLRSGCIDLRIVRITRRVWRIRRAK